MRFLHRLASLLALALLTGATLSAQSVDDIVSRNMAAKGGADRWKAITSMRLTGTLSTQGESLPLTILGKRPNLMRHEALTPSGPLVQAFDGTTPWTINPLAGSTTPQVVTGSQADLIKDQADFDGSLVDYKAKGTVVELVPAKDPGEDGFFHLKVTKKTGQVEDLYIDRKTGLDARSVRMVEEGGSMVAVTSELSDYRRVAGIMVPFTFRQIVNGIPVAQITVRKVEFNIPLDEGLFRFPGAK
jgi:outer membrane lipoprotein-sorting protein